MVDILAIGAHPDDIELSAGGTLLLHKAMGKSIAIVDLTLGELGTRGTAETRIDESKKSAQILGIKERLNLKLKDGFFIADENSLLKLIVAIRYFQPKIVLANAIEDRHPDHARAAEFAKQACFLSGLKKIVTDYKGKTQLPYRPAAVYHYIQEKYIKPDFVVDIGPWFTKKMEAIKAFETQFYDPNNATENTPISGEDYLKFLEGRAREMGRMIGVEFAEGFTSSKVPGISDLFSLK
jgi:bacillithiol biosynthesis deacetylase BshB1